MNWNWKLFAAVATMTGMIVGAGFLGMPYVVARSGFVIGLIQIILVGFIILVMKLYLGEILLRTKETHQLPGLARLYLGRWGYRIMLFSMIFAVYLSLTAYLMGQGQSLSHLFFGNANYALYFSLAFWFILSFLVYKGLRALKKGESLGLILVSFIMILILILFSSKIKIENLATSNINNAFLPFGVILFALLGFSAIPEVMRELRRNEKLMKKTILIGASLPIIMYTIFTFIVVGFAGSSTPEIATFALGKTFVLLGVLTIYTAFFAVSMAVRDLYRFDLGYSKSKAWFLACFVPLIIYLVVYFFELANFVELIGFTGAVFGTLNGILILLMVKRARKLGKRKPEYTVKLPSWIIWALILFLFAGLVFQLIF